MANGKKKNGTETEASTALATIGHSDYAIAKAGDVSAMLAANIGPRGLEATDLDRVGMPAGGGLQWMLPSIEGEKPANAIEGVIIAWRDVRLYWKGSIDEGGAGNPPDCISNDSFAAIGDPGGECDKCPFAQFGSAPGKGGKPGRGQACKIVRQLFVMRPDEIFPLVVNLPPSSQKIIRQFFRRLPRVYYSAVIKLELVRTTNKDNIAYSIVKPSIAAWLNPEATAYFQKISEAFLPHLTKTTVDGQEYPVEDVTEDDNDK